MSDLVQTDLGMPSGHQESITLSADPKRKANAGFLSVPIEPTTAMLEALFGGMGNCEPRRRQSAEAKYKRMLEASAPKLQHVE